MKIRNAVRDDLEQIVAIYNQAISAGQKTADTQTFTLEERINWFEHHNQNTFPLLVAVEGEQVIGYLTISAYRNGRPALNKSVEVSYYIHFKHHKKGVGSQLLQQSIMVCKELGYHTLLAILLSCNEGSISLLNKYGFKEWGRMPNIAHFGNKHFDHLYFGLHINN